MEMRNSDSIAMRSVRFDVYLEMAPSHILINIGSLYIILIFNLCTQNILNALRMYSPHRRSGRAFALHAVDRGSIPDQDRYK